MALIESPGTESPRNAWRLETPGSARLGTLGTAGRRAQAAHGVGRLPRQRADRGYLAEHIDPEYRDRIPRVEVTRGRQRVDDHRGQPAAARQRGRATPTVQEQQSFERPEHNRPYSARAEPEDAARNNAGRTIDARLADQRADGVDIELVFPNKGLLCWATPDPVFADAMCRAWNRWAYEWFGGADGWHDGPDPPARLDRDGRSGARRRGSDSGRPSTTSSGCASATAPSTDRSSGATSSTTIPGSSASGRSREELRLPLTFHVSTGRDPRAVGGNGGAIINYVCHSMETTIEPLVQMITSGVFERHPNLQAGLVESGIGFVPWLLETMDYAYRAHHFWVRPVIPELPSAYFRRHCFATFQEDHVGVDGAERYDIVDNVMWANDYPHHEGSWPHSAASIERQMGDLSDDSRAKILGLNAQRVFDL